MPADDRPGIAGAASPDPDHHDDHDQHDHHDVRPISYVVQSGDTLAKIADRFGVDYRGDRRANGIVEPDDIEVGQSLEIPEGLLVINDGQTSDTTEP